MWQCSFVYVFILLSCLSYVSLTAIRGDYDFDLLIFTQQWPATSCKEWKKHDPSHTCSMPKNADTWTIHGIWPTKFGTLGPAFCNRTWLFDPEKIRPIEDQLMQVWINIFGGTSLYSLWAHEWNKHGTCAAVLEPMNSELNYFKTGLTFLEKYSMFNILQSEGIVPSNTEEYSIVNINKAIKDKLGVDPVIECKKEDAGKSYISEIRICFTKDLNLTNCDGVVTRQAIGNDSILTNCKKTKNVVYPHYIQHYSANDSSPSRYTSVQMYHLIRWLQWLTL